MTGLKAVVFDLDDTLYPERQYVRSGFRAVAQWCNERFNLSAPIVQAELEALFDAGFIGDTFNWWLAEQGLPDALLPEMIQVYRDHKPQITLFPDTERILETLKTRFSLGLVTEGRMAVQEEKIRVLGLERWIQAVVITGEGDRKEWKPSRLPFDRILEILSAQGEEAVYIGDNPQKDFRGAREAGMRAIRIRREGGLHAEEEPATTEDAPSSEITNVGELLDMLG